KSSANREALHNGERRTCSRVVARIAASSPNRPAANQRRDVNNPDNRQCHSGQEPKLIGFPTPFHVQNVPVVASRRKSSAEDSRSSAGPQLTKRIDCFLRDIPA